MNSRTDVINDVVAKVGAVYYLEIGYQQGVNFSGVRCESKTAVDPDPDITPRPGDDLWVGTSDEFFANNRRTRWDVIFIDGLHHADQVGRDMTNAMGCLSEGGAIVLHDLNPATREQQEIPCRTAIWNGDCWRAWHGFVTTHPDVRTEFYRFDHGVGVIYPEGQVLSVEVDSVTRFEEYRAQMDAVTQDGPLWASLS